MRLFTLQTIGHDITQVHEPPRDYIDRPGPYWNIGEYLSWTYWIWCFQRIADFENEWLKSFEESLGYCTLWVLDVPRESIKWLGLGHQCDRIGPVEKWFFETPEDARAIDDIPQALVNRPVPHSWVFKVYEPRAFNKEKRIRS